MTSLRVSLPPVPVIAASPLWSLTNLLVNAPNDVSKPTEATGMISVRIGPVPTILISAAFAAVIFGNNKCGNGLLAWNNTLVASLTLVN